MRRIAQMLVFCAALSVVFAPSFACGPEIGYIVPGMEVDAQQHLIPVGPKSLQPPRTGSFYSFDHTATQLTIVDHWEWQTGASNVRRLLYLEANRGVLERTVKDDEIVAGPFGALVTEKTCFYNHPVDTYRSSLKILVQSLTPEIGREIPEPISAVPENIPSLTSVSIVRIFRSAPQFIFASGNYEANGTIGSIQSGEVMNGEVQNGSSVMMPGASQFNAIRQASGLPSRIDVENYLRRKHLPLPEISNPEDRTVVVLVYGFGELIRQGSLDRDAVISVRYFKPVMTEEERGVGPECVKRLRQQESTGKPTVE
jgi:hypothetical protein